MSSRNLGRTATGYHNLPPEEAPMKEAIMPEKEPEQEDAPQSGGPSLTRRALLGGMAATAAAPWLLRTAPAEAASLPAAALTPAILLPRRQHTATALGGGYILLAGGIYQGILDDVQIIGPNGAVTRGAPMLTPRYGHAAVLLSYGRVLVLGGFSGDVLDAAEVYDPSSNTWSEATPLALPRYNHTAVRVSNTQVLIVGGTYQDTLSDTETYVL